MKSLLVCLFSLLFGSLSMGQVVVFPTAPQSLSDATPPSMALPRSTQIVGGQVAGSTYPPGTVVSNPSIIGAINNAQPAVQPLWYQNLTDQREHDFGTVARASKQVHVFEFKNNTGADLFLTGIRTSCGCTQPRILTNHVKPDGLAQIEAKFDTVKFFGKRGATVSVSMQKTGPISEYAEIQFAVRGKIRRDVVLSPGQFEFPNVNVGEPAGSTANLWYAGRPDWKILDVKSTNPNLTVDIKELSRDINIGKTNYQLTVTVNGDQPAGPLMENLTIITNDPATSGMPVEVTGNVNTVISVAPIALGVVSQGQQITKRLIVRSPEPVAIDEIRISNDKIQFAPSTGKKTLHILTYTFDTSEPTDVAETMTLVTTGSKRRETKVAFSAQVVGSTKTSIENQQPAVAGN